MSESVKCENCGEEIYRGQRGTWLHRLSAQPNEDGPRHCRGRVATPPSPAQPAAPPFTRAEALDRAYKAVGIAGVKRPSTHELEVAERVAAALEDVATRTAATPPADAEQRARRGDPLFSAHLQSPIVAEMREAIADPLTPEGVRGCYQRAIDEIERIAAAIPTAPVVSYVVNCHRCAAKVELFPDAAAASRPLGEAEWVKEIEARCNAATRGRWQQRDPDVKSGEEIVIDSDSGEKGSAGQPLLSAVAVILNFANFMSFDEGHKRCDAQMRANATFIEHAHADIPRLIAALRNEEGRNG